MLDLIAIAFPGYFRAETCRMGRYFGIRKTSKPDDPADPPYGPPRLLAMVGERMIATPYREISALAVHPEATGGGLGSALLGHMLALHRAEASCSWLLATVDNTRAISLYKRMGFEHTRQILFSRLTRVD